MAVLLEFDGEWQWKWNWHKSWLQRFGNQVTNEEPFSTSGRNLLGDEGDTKDGDAGNKAQSLAADHDELQRKL